MEKLVAGYRRFRLDDWAAHRERFRTLAEAGQRPRSMIIACADSRVDPQMIFDAAPGELFVIRNVANLVPPYAPDGHYHGTSAALEFGVRSLRVINIVVLGHGQCGGVHVLLNGAPEPLSDFVGPWVEIAAPVRESVFRCEADPEARQRLAEHESVKLSLANLRTFPWIVEAERRGDLRLHGMWFEIATGRLMRLEPDGAFHVVSEGLGEPL